jgi:hypothetical protein
MTKGENMKRTILTALAITCLCINVAVARHPQGIGLGLMAGEPTGFSAKVWTGRHVALDLGVGYSYWWYGHSIQVHGDILGHTRNLIQSENGYLPLYLGIGARVKFADEAHNYPDMRIGLRIPFGIEYVFASAPLGLFLELVPIIDLSPGTNVSGNSAIGFRYYFTGLAED